ncbi:MAG: hypothetical protein WBB27_11725 [Maribacter sp.]
MGDKVVVENLNINLIGKFDNIKMNVRFIKEFIGQKNHYIGTEGQRHPDYLKKLAPTGNVDRYSLSVIYSLNH